MAKGERGTARPYLRGRIWWIKFYVPGEQKARYESSQSTDKKDAQRLLNLRSSEIDNRQTSSRNVFISDLPGLYLADQRKQRRLSFKQAEGYVRLHLKPAFGRIKATAIRTQMINSFINEKQIAGYANGTINRWLEALPRSYTLAITALPPLVSAVPGIEMLQQNNVREGFLEHDEYVRLRSELPDHQRLILVIGYRLGRRGGEVLGLRRGQVDWTENLVRLEKSQTKTKRGACRTFVWRSSLLLGARLRIANTGSSLYSVLARTGYI